MTRGPLLGSRQGFALALVLVLVLVGTGVAGMSAVLAVGELRWAVGAHRRVRAELAAREGVALPWTVSSLPAGQGTPQVISTSEGPDGVTVSRRAEWLAPDLVLGSATGVAGGEGVSRTIRALLWRLSEEVMIDLPGTALSAGGVSWSVPAAADTIWRPLELLDGCALWPGNPPVVGALPPRWNRPLDLAAGWRPGTEGGGAVPDSGVLLALRHLEGPGIAVLGDPGRFSSAPLPQGGAGGTEGGGESEASNPIPMIVIAPGDLTVEAGSKMAGLALVGGDLDLEPGAGFAGVARVGGTLRASSPQLVGDRCVARRALRRSHLWDRLLHVPGGEWIRP